MKQEWEADDKRALDVVSTTTLPIPSHEEMQKKPLQGTSQTRRTGGSKVGDNGDPTADRKVTGVHLYPTMDDPGAVIPQQAVDMEGVVDKRDHPYEWPKDNQEDQVTNEHTGQTLEALEQISKELDHAQDNLDTRLPKHLSLALKSELREHQVKGVAWMLKRERGLDGMPVTWEVRRVNGQLAYYNTITCSYRHTAPEPVLGGILADEMGLGKTLQILSLVVANRWQENATSTPTLDALADKVKGGDISGQREYDEKRVRRKLG